MNPTEVGAAIGQTADHVGPAAAVLLAILLAILFVVWRVAKWIAPRADKVVDAHANFVNTCADKLPAIEKRQAEFCETQDQHGRRIEEIHSHVQIIRGAMGK